MRQRDKRVVESKWLVENASCLEVEWLLIMRTVGEVGASDDSKADTHNKSEETVSRKTSSSPSWPGAIENAEGNHDKQLKKRNEWRAKNKAGMSRSLGLGIYTTETCVIVEAPI
jgi:hypothetical protein